MWKSTLRDWPEEHVPVAVWECDSLGVALRVEGKWYACTPAGDVVFGTSGSGPLIVHPEKWAYLPAQLVKLRRKLKQR